MTPQTTPEAELAARLIDHAQNFQGPMWDDIRAAAAALQATAEPRGECTIRDGFAACPYKAGGSLNLNDCHKPGGCLASSLPLLNQELSPCTSVTATASCPAGVELAAELTDEQIKHMVGRFLGWRLPQPFRPDNGISFTPTAHQQGQNADSHLPSGTNLFGYTEAEAMVRYMLEGLA